MITCLRNKHRLRIALATGAVIAVSGGSLALAAGPATASPAAASPAAASPAAASACTSPVVPPGRVWESWAYDPATRQVVLFGGDKTNGQVNSGTVFGDTWTWNDGVWTRRHPADSPQPRTGAALAYDYQTHQLILFGGSSRPGTAGPFSSQTWRWTGSNWVLLHPAHVPPARHNAGLAYDDAGHALIMFGGYGGSYLSDTWKWTGSDWVELHPAHSPPPRDTDSLIFDKTAKQLVLWGGYNGARLSDTWTWNNTDWTQQHPARTPDFNPSAAWQAGFDPPTGETIVFGGFSVGRGANYETWNWNGANWIRLFPRSSPAWRKYGSMTYDGALRELVLFGGFDGVDRPGSVWGWTGSVWRLIGCRS